MWAVSLRVLAFIKFLITAVHMSRYKHWSNSSFTGDAVALLFLQNKFWLIPLNLILIYFNKFYEHMTSNSVI